MDSSFGRYIGDAMVALIVWGGLAVFLAGVAVGALLVWIF